MSTRIARITKIPMRRSMTSTVSQRASPTDPESKSPLPSPRWFKRLIQAPVADISPRHCRQPVSDMHPTLVILVVGLAPALVGEHTPNLRRLAAQGAHASARHRNAGGDLHRAVDPGHGADAGRPRRRGQRLVLPRAGRGLAVAPVEPADRRREDLGSRQTTRSRLHLRQDVLVVQHVRLGRLERDAAADVPGGRPQDTGPLRAPARAA